MTLKLSLTKASCRGEYNHLEDMFHYIYHDGSASYNGRKCLVFGVFDGHDGPEAALYASNNLVEAIVRRKKFWSEDDVEVLNTIRKGFVETHYDMWKIHETWPRRADQFYSSSGTTASVAFIRNGKIYVGHVGDTRIVLGYQSNGENKWKARALTIDHKPDVPSEMSRIIECGGQISKSYGISRVVWSRPSLKHKGPGMKSAPEDEIPFLAVSRSLGDLWSYNCETKKYVVSPEPDVSVHPINSECFRCLIFGTYSVWDFMNPNEAVKIVECAVKNNETNVLKVNKKIDPSTSLVSKVANIWRTVGQKSERANVVTVTTDLGYLRESRVHRPRMLPML